MPRILIIDDEPAIRTTLSSILTDEKHTVVACESGEEGMARFAREEFDLVLLDLWLPGVDGMTVLERLHGAGPAPIIVISGNGTVDTASVRHGSAYDSWRSRSPSSAFCSP